MIRHVFVLAWHRRRANALLILELLATFLVLFGLASFSLDLLRLYRTPLGFDYTDTWAVNLTTGAQWDALKDEATLQQLLSAVEQMSEVDAAHVLGDPPFEADSGSGIGFPWQSAPIEAAINTASDGLLEALEVKLLEGRWFGPQDEGQAYVPIVINRALREAFGVDDVVGVEFLSGEEHLRIVGVFEEFRLDGDFIPVKPLMFRRNNAGGDDELSLTVLLKPGVSAAFEEKLLERMLGAAPDWDFDVAPWATLRQEHIRAYTLPLLVGGVLVLFLLILVGGGMLGVLWQNIIRRMPEMGLRRALGASANAVRLQVVLELVAMSCMALLLGFAIVVQLPLSGVWQILDWDLFIPAVITSTLVLLGACVLFALYPSYLATSRNPVDALRHE